MADVNTMDYVTIASTGNATDFGDLAFAFREATACSNNSRGIFAGDRPTPLDTIEYITIDTTGNSTDFGDLTVARYSMGGLSGDS